jgi:hypothetical protein
MTTKPKTRKVPAAKTTSSRSRQYRISRMRNAIIVAHTAIGEPGLLPEDLMEISRAINREYQNLATLISLLETAS